MVGLRAWGPAVAGLLILSGCVPSLQPLYTERDLVFDPGLIGTWKDPEGDTTWVVRQAAPTVYRVASSEKGETHEFKLRLVRLGDRQFMDLEPAEGLDLKNEIFRAHFIGVHTFYRYNRKGDVVMVEALDPRFIQRLLAEKKTAIAQLCDDDVVLTGSTAQLQEYLLKHAGVPEAFTDPTELRRAR